MTEFKIIKLEDGTREEAVRYSYGLENCGFIEMDVHDECNEIFDKLNEIKEWRRRKECIGVGCFKKSKKKVEY